MKQQVMLIHGGNTHESYEAYLEYLQSYKLDFETQSTRGWKQNLADRLGDAFEVIAPSVPCKRNAKYLEWKIWFEKFIPLLRNGVILVGHSLGGLFLVKYLSEELLPVQVKATLLVATPFGSTTRRPDGLGDYILPEKLDRFVQEGGEITIFHSQDDQVVPFTEATVLLGHLRGATLQSFENRGHFNNETFPELEDKIRELSLDS